MGTQFLLLTTRRFLPLFVTQFLGAFNDNVFKNALVILITYKITTLSPASTQLLVTLAAGIFIIPYFLFSALAGQIADRFEKSHLISIIKFFEIVIMLIGAVGFYLQNVTFLMVGLFALGMQATFFGPLKYSILPDHLRADELIGGNGLIDAGTFLAILIGTIFGGVLILIKHGELVIAGVTLTAALCGWLMSLNIPLAKSDKPNMSLQFNIFIKTYELLAYAFSQKLLFICIIGISWFWLIGAAFLAEFPIFGKQELRVEGRVVTYFLTLFSIGLGLGSLLCNRILKGEIRAIYVPVAALGISLFIIDLYFATRPLIATGYMSLSQFLHTFVGWRISADLLLTAICGGLYAVPLYTILQFRSPKEHRARVIASNNVMNALFMVIIAGVIIGLLKAGFKVSQIFLLIAIVNVGMAAYLQKLTRL